MIHESNTKEDKFIDNVVISLKRNYSKDEFVSHLINQNKHLKTEIGKLKSYIDELEYYKPKIDSLIKLEKKNENQRKYIIDHQKKISELNKDLKQAKAIIEDQKNEIQDLYSKHF